MKKFLLLLSVAFATVFSSNAQELDFANASVWNNGGTIEGKTVHFTAAWSGLAWWLGGSIEANTVTVVFDGPTAMATQIFAQYAEDDIEDFKVWINAGETSVTAELPVGTLNQIAIQNSEEGDVAFVSVTLSNGTPGEEPIGEKNYIVKDDVEGAQKLIGWGGSMAISIVENEDGHNYEINNPETAENNWNIQVAYDVEDAYEVGTTYYLEYDIKGSVAGKTFAAGLQRTSDYAGCGDFGSVDVTTEWKHVKLSAKCSTEGATRLVISVGDYAGVLSLDNVEVYTLVEGGDTAINNIANEVTTDGAMYDLSGRRVVKAEGIVVKNGKIMLVK